VAYDLNCKPLHPLISSMRNTDRVFRRFKIPHFSRDFVNSVRPVRQQKNRPTYSAAKTRPLVQPWILLLIALAVPAARSATLQWPGSDSTYVLRSCLFQKALFLNVEDAVRTLPLVTRQDREAGLLVLCSAHDCLPIFVQDSLDVQIQDSACFLQTNRIAEALNCRAQIKKHDRILLTCQTILPTQKVGAMPGNRAPGFRLHDAQDSAASLQDFLDHGPVILVFVRSGDWDPYSRLLLSMLETARDTIRGAGYQTLVLHGYEPKVAAKWKKDLALTMPLLSDQYSAVMRGYEVFDKGHLPVPALFAIDRKGTVQLRIVRDNGDAPPDLTPVMEFIKNR
jgi:peroxiredoxin